VAPAPEISVAACAAAANDTVATAAVSTRLTLRKFMYPLLLIYEILPGASEDLAPQGRIT
jgi:hypothetical protein